MLFRKMLISSLLTISLCLSVTAYADVTINNQTDYDTTALINKDTCSTLMRAIGVTPSHGRVIIPISKLKLACNADRENCEARVFMNNNCSVNKPKEVAKKDIVAIVIINAYTGIIKSIDDQYSHFRISGLNTSEVTITDVGDASTRANWFTKILGW